MRINTWFQCLSTFQVISFSMILFSLSIYSFIVYVNINPPLINLMQSQILVLLSGILFILSTVFRIEDMESLP